MGVLDWLFGWKPKPAVPEEQPKPQRILYDAPADSWPLPNRAVTVPPPAAEPPRDPARGDTFWLDYATSGHSVRRRNVIFLFGSPGTLVTGVDLDQRRLRTYLLGRMRKVIRPADMAEFDPMRFFSDYEVVPRKDLAEREEPRAVALDMRKAMFCQLALLLLIATADEPVTSERLNLIMAYVKRENRFATREGWVPVGDKKLAWPLLRDMIQTLPVRRDHIDVYVGTLRENWENSRRFAALNDALSELINLGAGPTPNMRALGEAINRGGH